MLNLAVRNEKPGFRYHSPHPKLLTFSGCEGNIKAVQRVLYIPSSKNAVALIVGFDKILQYSKAAFSNIQNCSDSIQAFQ